MQVQFNVNADCKLVVEVPDVTQAFQFIAYVESVFSVDRCGNCGKDNLQLTHRQPQGFDYYSVTCKDCHHELKFGQVRETKHLFPKGWEPPYEGDSENGGSGGDESRTSGSESQEPAHADTIPF